MKSLKQYGLLILEVICTLTFLTELAGQGKFNSFFSSIFFILLVLFYIKSYKLFISSSIRKKVILTICSCMFSIFMIIGGLFENQEYYQSVPNLAIHILTLSAGYFFLFINIMLTIIEFMEKKEFTPNTIRPIGAVLIIAAFSIYYLIVFYPGVTFNDGMRQLHSFYRDIQWANHDPVFATAILGTCVKLGSSLINDNFGFFLFSFLVTAISLLVFYYMYKTMEKLKANKVVVTSSIIYFSLLPIIRLYIITLCKDTLFALMTLLLVSILANMYIRLKNEEKILNREYIFLFAVMLLLCNLRNDGKYIVLFTLAGLFLAASKKKKLIYISFVAAILVFSFLYSNIILPAIDVKEGSIREALSVPLQQTALYIREYPDELDNEDKQILNDVFKCKLTKVGKLYNPEISDPVKGQFIHSPSSQQLKSYFKVWWKGLKKHPKLYVRAYLNNYYGYIYPCRLGDEWGFPVFAISEKYLYRFDIHFGLRADKLREQVIRFVDFLIKAPILSLLYCPGMYVWILLFYIMYCIIKKYGRAIIPVMPLLGVVIVACLSPVNCRVRYVLSLVFCLPLVLSILQNITGEKISGQSGQSEQER